MPLVSSQTLEPVSPLRQQRRFALRRDRILPGPLKALPRRRTASWQVSFAIFAGFVAAAGSAVAYLSTRPGSETASAAAEPPAVAVASVAAEQPREIRAVVPPSIAPIKAPTEKYAVAPPPAPVEAAPASRKQVADKPDFQLDSLPVLQADEASFGLDPGSVPEAVPPAVRSGKAVSGRTSVAQKNRPAPPRSSAILPASQ